MDAIGLPERLRAARAKVKWPLRVLARHLGTTKQTVANWENGTYEPGGDFIGRLVEFIRAAETGAINATVPQRSVRAYGVARTPKVGQKGRFIALLKRVRQAKGWTQEELADHLGCSVWTVRHWEKGDNFPKGVAYTRKLHELLRETMPEEGAELATVA